MNKQAALQDIALKDCIPSRTLVEKFIGASEEEHKTFDMKTVEAAFRHIYHCMGALLGDAPRPCEQLWQKLYEQRNAYSLEIRDLIVRWHRQGSFDVRSAK